MAIPVSELSMGPMIGSTSPRGFRLWGQGPDDSAAGVARVFKDKTGERVAERVFPFIEFYDYVGIVDFGVLEDGTESQDAITPGLHYRFEMGCVRGVSADDLKNRLANGETLNWDALSGDEHRGSLRTFPETTIDEPVETSFILGSCRDPRGKTGEPTFGTILKKISNGVEPRPDFILMTGDQIYIDRPPKDWRWLIKLLKPKGPIPLDYFWETYRLAFGKRNPNFAAVIRRLPTYFMLDDHEIKNNWTGAKFTNKDKRFFPKTFAHGQQAFEAYQACLGKRVKSADTFGPDAFPRKGKDKEYWFEFSHGNCDFFMADVRTGNERHKGVSGEPKVLRGKQYKELITWLKRDTGRVKFIVSPVPVFPDTRPYLLFSSTRDKWGGGVQQRHELLEFIRNEPISKVIFLSGDVHVSYVAELTNKNDPDFKVYQIVSSAFNWIPPGLQKVHFNFGSLKLKNACGERPSKDYYSKRYRTQACASNLHHANNFARISATKDSVKVEYFRGRDGKILETVDIALQSPDC